MRFGISVRSLLRAGESGDFSLGFWFKYQKEKPLFGRSVEIYQELSRHISGPLSVLIDGRLIPVWW